MSSGPVAAGTAPINTGLIKGDTTSALAGGVMFGISAGFQYAAGAA